MSSSDLGSSKKTTYVTVPLLDLYADRELPCDFFIFLNQKMVKYRIKGDFIASDAFNKLIYNKVRYVFIDDEDRTAYYQWEKAGAESMAPEEKALHENPETQPIAEAALATRRAMMDIFEAPRDEKAVRGAIEASRRMVGEFLRKPFAVNNIQALQRYKKGTVDHSVNVSILGVFLGLRMGYTHQLILENLAIGGLLHDIGKVMIEPSQSSDGPSEFSPDEDPAMQEHPKIARDHLEQKNEVSNEVRMIVGQHHEFLDGSGYPNKLKGLAVYDLARLVAIANIYDNLISQSLAESMKDRMTEALSKLETEYEGKLDPKKLEKVIKILRYSFL